MIFLHRSEGKKGKFMDKVENKTIGKKEKQNDESINIFLDIAVPIIVSIIGSVITSLIVLRLLVL